MKTLHPAAEFIGDPTECTALFPFAGKWYAPNPAFRRLLGSFGEPLVRNIIGNSVKEINPATMSSEIADVIHRVCETAKKNRKCETKPSHSEQPSSSDLSPSP
jgi:hypothetical protein